jgi:signal transduction histidine kinase
MLPKIPPALRMLGVKIAAAIGLTAALVSIAVGLLVHQRIASDLLGSARRELDTQLVRAADDYASGRRLQARLDPTDLPAPVAAAIRHGQRVTYLQNTAHGPVLWAATMVSDRTVLALTTPYTRQSRDLAALEDSLLAAGATATALALAAGLGIGVRMGRRATAAALTAERIADGDLDARIHPTGQDEIARLATSVNTMAGALGARLEAERRVTADIAHELRTPVAGLLTAADLLPPSRPTQLVQERADALSRLVEDVLEVARLDAQCTTTTLEPCLLSSLAQRAVAGAGAQPAAVEIKVLDEEVVETDPRRVERIIANLVLNALRHGALPVTVEVTARRLTVRDRGPGFPDDLLLVLRTSGPQRFRTGAPERGHGVGLGLTIAVGQARVLGARLHFGNHPEGGAQAVLDLPQPPAPDTTSRPNSPARHSQATYD